MGASCNASRSPHPLELFNRISDAAIGSNTHLALERLVDGSIVGTLALTLLGRSMDFTGGKSP
jgi:hypothetical protein